MSNFEHRITEDSTEFEKAFLKIYDGNLWTALDKMKDWQPPKPLVVVPEFVAEYIERCKSYGCGLIWAITPDRDANDNSEEVYDWLFPNGHRLEDGSFPDPFEPDNLVRPDSGNQLKFARAWIDGYTVEKEKKYILKHIDMSKFSKGDSLYLSRSIKEEVFGKYDHMRVPDGVDVSEIEQCHFNQSEIESLFFKEYHSFTRNDK